MPITPSLERDPTDGALIADYPEPHLYLNEPALRCLDVANAPALALIDLTAQTHPITLTVRGAPRLRHIRLPAAGGNVVRVDFGARVGALFIEGPLQEVDGCWLGGAFRLAARAAPLAGCAIGSALPAELPEGLVLVEPAARELALDLAALRQVAVIGARGLQRVRFGRVDAALLQDCPALRQVGATAVERLRLDGCAGIETIDGTGRSLGVRGGAADALQISGAWSRLALGECGTRALDAPHSAQVSLRALPALERLTLAREARLRVGGNVNARGVSQAAVELDAAAVASLAEQALGGDATALAVLAQWCGRARSPRARLHGLRGLAQAARPGADIAALWRLRCRLNSDPRDGRTLDEGAVVRRALSGWHWELPRDLAQEGWDADLGIWLACRQWPEAAPFRRVLGRARTPLQIATLARAAGARTTDPQTRAELAELLLKSLRRTPPPLSAKDKRAHLAQADHVLHAVLTVGRPALAEAFADYATRQIEGVHCVPLLRRLASLGVARARVHLMALAQGASFPHVREQALAAALAPVRARLFAAPPAHTESTTTEENR